MDEFFFFLQFFKVSVRKILIHVYDIFIGITRLMNFHEISQHLVLKTINKNVNPIALRKAKIVYYFGSSECCRVKIVATLFCLVWGLCMYIYMKKRHLKIRVLSV